MTRDAAPRPRNRLVARASNGDRRAWAGAENAAAFVGSIDRFYAERGDEVGAATFDKDRGPGLLAGRQEARALAARANAGR